LKSENRVAKGEARCKLISSAIDTHPARERERERRKRGGRE
jgi:hypothetical protein